jgi:hypothetical protein
MSKRRINCEVCCRFERKCGKPDMDLLTKVTIGCGPSIYNADAATIAGSQQSELDMVKTI